MSHFEKPILFSEESLGKRSVGVIQLHRPKALHALNTECYSILEPRLLEWAKDDQIAAIIIEASEGRAFCAGGDVKTLVIETQKKGLSYAKDFFTREYFVDYLIHAYPKPVIAFADGITMGGGVGLINGAAHRVVTERTVMAMPEQAIGLFPDVGATRFLHNLPENFGLFMGLSGARLQGVDALAVGLADYYIPSALMRKVRSDVLRLPWTDSAKLNSQMITDYFKKALPPAPLSLNWEVYSEIQPYFNTQDYHDLHAKMLNHSAKSQFVSENRERFLAGSPTSKQVFFAAYHRHKNFSMADTFIAEWEMAIRFSKENEFFEGVRAVLIDKDNNPRWNPVDEKAVQNVSRFFHSEEENLLAQKIRDLSF